MKRKKLFLVAALMAALVARASSDEVNALRIHCKSGNEVTIALEEKPAVKFAGNEVVIATHLNIVSYPAADVVKFTYVAMAPTSISDKRSAGVVFSFGKDSMTASHLVPLSEVSLFTPDGKLVTVATSDDNGDAILQLPEMRTAIYIVKTSSTSFKIRKP